MMSHLLSFLALYGWPQPLDLSKRPDALVSLVGDAKIAPTKATFFVPKEKKERRRTLFKKTRLTDVLAQFPSYEWVALDEPIDGDFRNVRSHLHFHAVRKRYSIGKVFGSFQVQDALRHVRMFCGLATPRYGFLHAERGATALFFPWGVSTMSSDRTVRQRVADLGHSLHGAKEHLTSKLHDAYPLNILSPLHLERLVQGKPLRQWIQSGGRGEIIVINDDVFAWIIPDEVRPTVRAELFEANVLIATV